MNALPSQELAPVLDRYEIKYLIPESLVGPISRFAGIYCSLDNYSLMSPDGYYQVNNLYFDSPGFIFYRNRLDDAENRFNMRVRSYGEDPSPPYYLEIKQKRSGVVKKFRGKVEGEDWFRILEESLPDKYASGLSAREKSNIDLFIRLARSYDAAPRVLTHYRRKAYVSLCEEYARLTFDRELHYMAQDRYQLRPEPGMMVPYDHELYFDPGCSIIMELKCYTSHVPIWMMDLVRTFDLQPRGFSKYSAGMTEVLEPGYAGFDRAGTALDY